MRMSVKNLLKISFCAVLAAMVPLSPAHAENDACDGHLEAEQVCEDIAKACWRRNYRIFLGLYFIFGPEKAEAMNSKLGLNDSDEDCRQEMYQCVNSVNYFYCDEGCDAACVDPSVTPKCDQCIQVY